MSTYQYCFWDLDGTLVDSAPGITASLRYAMEHLQLPIPADVDLRCFIGPPLAWGFSTFFGLSEKDAARAVVLYRENYRAGGLLNCRLYDGVEDTLRALRARGIPCVLATCKPHEFATRIIRHFELEDCFSLIVGPEMDGTRGEKKEVIEHAMKTLGISDARTVLMVGDRQNDVLGAAACDVNCLGALWGFGTKEELEQAGAVALLTHPASVMHYFS